MKQSLLKQGMTEGLVLVSHVQRFVENIDRPVLLMSELCEYLFKKVNLKSCWGIINGRFGQTGTMCRIDCETGKSAQIDLLAGNPIPQCIRELPYVDTYLVDHPLNTRWIEAESCTDCVYCNGVPGGSLLIDLGFRKRVRGWLNLTFTESREDVEKAQGLFQLVADIVGYAIDTQMIYHEYQILEDQFRKILKNTSEAVIGFNLDNKITFWNQGAQRLTGYDSSHATGQDIRFLFQKDAYSEFEGLLKETEKAGKTLTRIISCLHASGSTVKVEFNVWKELDTLGNPIGRIAIIKDVESELRMKSAVKESEYRFKTLYENIPGGMLIIDSNYVITDVNTRTCEVTGYTREELVGQFCDIVCPKGSESKMCPIWEEDQMGFSGMDTAIKCKDGRKKPILKNAKRITVNGEECILENFQDVSNLKEVEHALKLNEKKYRLLADNTLDCIWVMNGELEITYINPAIEKMLGYPMIDLVGKQFDLILDKSSYKRLESKLKTRLANPANNSNIIFEARCMHQKGHLVPVEFMARLIKDPDSGEFGIQGTIRDFSERMMAAKERDRLLSAIHQTGEIILIADPQGKLEFANPSFERITGFSAEEVVGKTQRIFRDDYLDKDLRDEIWDTISAGRSWQGRLENTRKDDTPYMEDATISPVFDENSKIINYITVKRDVTRELELESQLRHSQKLEAVGQLAGGVAHDFNNLLQVMAGYLELACDDLGEDHEVIPSLKEVEAATTRAGRLVSQMLAFSRRQIMRPQNLDLNDVISGLMKMLGRVITENISLDFVPGHMLGKIHADPGMMEQVILNLCVNARDAMSGGGSLTIETENVLINGDYARMHVWARPGRYVLLSITDTGIGMNDEIQSKIFEPFFTTKDVGRGTGLGLSMVYGIVKQHNGMINVYSESGKGTTFKIYIPIVERSATEVGSKVSSQPTGGTEVILIAEDDLMVLKLTSRILEKAGYTVLTARNGDEAIELYKVNRDKIDLLLLDVVMPLKGGKDVADYVAASNPEIPVIFTSGYNENAIHKNFVLNDEIILIQKPFARENLLETVRTVLDKHKP